MENNLSFSDQKFDVKSSHHSCKKPAFTLIHLYKHSSKWAPYARLETSFSRYVLYYEPRMMILTDHKLSTHASTKVLARAATAQHI